MPVRFRRPFLRGCQLAICLRHLREHLEHGGDRKGLGAAGARVRVLWSLQQGTQSEGARWLGMPRQPSRRGSSRRDQAQTQQATPWARTVHGAAMPRRSTKIEAPPTPRWPPVPDMFDVITYFLDRGESYTVIASIGFWTKENPHKALTARALKLWYEAELDRRTAARQSTRET